MRKPSSPEDMKYLINEEDLQVAIDEFEINLDSQERGKDYYHLVIAGELQREICDEIQRLYLEAGWVKVVCKTSSEDNERAGLTGLQLWRTKE